MDFQLDIDKQLEIMQIRKDGYFSNLHDEDSYGVFIKSLRVLGVLGGDNLSKIEGIHFNSEDKFRKIFIESLAKKDSVTSPGCWTLYWILSHAVHELLLFSQQGIHEPTLTGALMSNIRCAIKSATNPGESEVVGVHIADHQALYNEKHSGADFGIIIEICQNERLRYATTLVQAKRAKSRNISVDKLQNQKLQDSKIGSYVFYNEFKVGNHSGILSPTIKSCASVYNDISSGRSTSVVIDASDFALTVAFGMTKKTSPIGLVLDSPEDAIERLFSVDGVSLNHILVTAIQDRAYSIDEILSFEENWREKIETAMLNRREGREVLDNGDSYKI